VSVPFRQRPEFQRGRAAEQMVARWLQERGWYVIPSYDYSGEDGEKAPRMQGLKRGFAVPDLDVARGGKRRWVEVKAKSRANPRHDAYWGSREVPEHGIDHKNYADYLDVKAESGDEVWIAIYEMDTGALLMAEVDALGKPRIGTSNGKKIANWPRDRFREVHRFPPGSLSPVRPSPEGGPHATPSARPVVRAAPAAGVR
jgi:cytosine/adenosine deaminase-related metal-dependent hydrolase